MTDTVPDREERIKHARFFIENWLYNEDGALDEWLSGAADLLWDVVGLDNEAWEKESERIAALYRDAEAAAYHEAQP